MGHNQQFDEQTAERLIDEWAQKSSPDKMSKLDRQFGDKLTRLEQRGQASDAMLAHLRLFWRMLQAPDSEVPWKAKSLLMAGLMYFASPFDLIPDIAGKLGYMDDAAVLRVVSRRLETEIAAFRQRHG